MTAPGVRIGRLLAERIAEAAAQYRPSRTNSQPDSLGGYDAIAGGERAVERPLDLWHRPDGMSSKNSHKIPSAHQGMASRPKLLVAPRAARGTHEDADATERLALSSRVPTLVVQDPARLHAWLRGKRALRVLCAHDLTLIADEALHFVRLLSKVGPCEITLAHVHRSIDLPIAGSHNGLASMPQYDIRTRTLVEMKLRERAESLLVDTPINTHVSLTPYRPDDFISETVRRSDPDLVVTPIHPHAESGSTLGATTSRALLCCADSNLVIVPPTSAPAESGENVVRRVLVVAEFKPSDARVISQARAILSPGGTMRVLHILHPHAVPDLEKGRILTFRQQVAEHLELVEATSMRLRTLAQNEADVTGASVESEVVEHRDHARAIADATMRFNADVVCLASADRHTFQARLLDWKVRRILTKAKRSVLVVHPPRS